MVSPACWTIENNCYNFAMDFHFQWEHKIPIGGFKPPIKPWAAKQMDFQQKNVHYLQSFARLIMQLHFVGSSGFVLLNYNFTWNNE